MIKRVIEKGLHKAALIYLYFESSPRSTLLCQCGRGEARVPEIFRSSYSLEMHTQEWGKKIC